MKKKKNWIIVLMLVFVVAATATVLIIVSKKPKDEPQTGETHAITIGWDLPVATIENEEFLGFNCSSKYFLTQKDDTLFIRNNTGKAVYMISMTEELKKINDNEKVVKAGWLNENCVYFITNKSCLYYDIGTYKSTVIESGVDLKDNIMPFDMQEQFILLGKRDSASSEKLPLYQALLPNSTRLLALDAAYARFVGLDKVLYAQGSDEIKTLMLLSLTGDTPKTIYEAEDNSRITDILTECENQEFVLFEQTASDNVKTPHAFIHIQETTIKLADKIDLPFDKFDKFLLCAHENNFVVKLKDGMKTDYYQISLDDFSYEHLLTSDKFEGDLYLSMKEKIYITIDKGVISVYELKHE